MATDGHIRYEIDKRAAATAGAIADPATKHADYIATLVAERQQQLHTTTEESQP